VKFPIMRRIGEWRRGRQSVRARRTVTAHRVAPAGHRRAATTTSRSRTDNRAIPATDLRHDGNVMGQHPIFSPSEARSASASISRRNREERHRAAQGSRQVTRGGSRANQPVTRGADALASSTAGAWSPSRSPKPAPKPREAGDSSSRRRHAIKDSPDSQKIATLSPGVGQAQPHPRRQPADDQCRARQMPNHTGASRLGAKGSRGEPRLGLSLRPQSVRAATRAWW